MYRVDFSAEALAAVDALPVPAALGYAEVLGALQVAPWSGAPINASNPDGAVRIMVFGPGGDGFVTYLILEDQRRVDVLTVQWAGD